LFRFDNIFYGALNDKKVTCTEANNTISSFSPVDHMLQVNFQEGESSLLQCASVDVPDLCSNRFEKALLPNINNDAAKKGRECLHILSLRLLKMYLSQGQLKNKETMLNTCEDNSNVRKGE
jgi:hypothetical protein